MEFRILGSLEVLDEGRAITLGGSKQRALLALLLLHPNETLSTDRLIDELWGERPPANAAKTVQMQISRLRKVLAGEAGNGSAGVVVTRERGYELRLDPERLDSHRFERLVAEGRRELEARRPERAVSTLEGALSLWRGAPLAELAYEPFAQGEIGRLEGLRIAAVEELIEAKLTLGRHADVVERLEALIAEHPYRERLRAQLMLALYRSDRQADALQAYQNARRTLVEELGIEPGERLRELEGAILAQDPALASPSVEAVEPAPAPEAGPLDSAPVSVPLARALRFPASAPFVARAHELARLRALWAEVAAGARAAVVVAGEAGIGKTRLAAELARTVQRAGGLVLYGRCDEGLAVPYQPFVEALRPAATAMGPDRLRAELGRFAPELVRLLPELGPLGEPARADPETERFAMFEAVSALVEAATRERRTLLMLDDLHWAATPTLLLLRHLIRSERPLGALLVAAYRDTELDIRHPLAQLLVDLKRDASVETMTLGGLEEREIARLLEAAAGHAPERRGAELAALLQTETGGNPFFIRELLANLIESGAIGREGERWEDLRASELEVPEGLRQVIRQRVARLSEGAREALSVAAVVGPTFAFATVEHVLSGEPGLLDSLDEVAGRGLLVEAGQGDYAFVHVLVSQTIYAELSSPRRMRLHRQVGEALEALVDVDANVEALAYHFAEAARDGQARKAAYYALAAGRSATARLAYEQAAAHYERGLKALEAADQPDEKLRRELMLALRKTHYEPLPDLGALPGWIWRRLPRAGKVAVALLPVVVVVLVLLLGPGIERAKQDRTRSEEQRLERARAERVERIRAEQRPRFGRAGAAGGDLARRERLLDDVTANLREDARARVAAGALDGPILRVECEPFPRTVDGTGAHDDPSRRFGRYACLAVTRDVVGGAGKKIAAVGHPYRLLIDFESGRYGFCRITGYATPGRRPRTSDPIVPVPRACGGT
jgi:DNA-binding SARP family transcriptional activator